MPPPPPPVAPVTGCVVIGVTAVLAGAAPRAHAHLVCPALTAAAQHDVGAALEQYIHDNTEDQCTDFTVVDADLARKGAEPANREQCRTWPSSKATGAQQIGRLANLMQLTVDTS